MEQQFNFNNELSGKIVLVTGGTKGAGKAIAERLLQAGATIIITARNAPRKRQRKITFHFG
jgi:NAD(P)-dependent dehydrogenase (short-subunit alcohol dehydrogenase family)